jgi:hypothetical protein
MCGRSTGVREGRTIVGAVRVGRDVWAEHWCTRG